MAEICYHRYVISSSVHFCEH